MNRQSILKLLHFVYLGFLLTFIYFYFSAYQPLKLHNTCAISSSQQVLNSKNQERAYELYKELYADCISEKSITLLTLFK